MPTLKQIIFASVLICVLLSTAAAQESTTAQRASLTITASAAGERVRITAPSSVVQMRVEVYAPSGEKLFDQEIRGGNVFDWHLQDGQAQRLVPGAYVCVVTAKNISGKLTQKIGTVRVEENSVSVQPAESLSAPQAHTIGPVEENSSWTILGEKENQTTTVIAHDGADGQLIRGRGALTFRVGDFFSGNDQEQMRLTEDGDLGIGTAKPKAKLDVAGTIRARGGFAFSDGSTLNVNDKGALTVTSANGNVVPSAAGSGTLNRLAKWTETGGSGTLGDSLLNESGGGIEVRPAAAGGSGVNPIILNPNNVPGFAQFQFYPATGTNANMSFTVVPRGTGTPGNKAQFSIFGTDLFADAINYEFASLRARGSDFVFGTGKSGTGQIRPLMLAAGFLSDNTTNNGQLYLATNGNVGISTVTPTSKLTVQTATGNYGFTHTDGVTAVGSYVGGSASGASGGWFGTLTTSPLHFFTGGGQPSMTITPTGNVGVGNFSPSFKFDVAGNLRSVGSSSNDILVQTTGGTNAWARYNIQTTNQNWVLGSSQNFNGDQFYLYDSTFNTTRMMIQPNNGPIAFPTGTVSMPVLQITGGSDLAEQFEIGEGAKPGMLVSIDPLHAGRLAIARGAYNRRVAGIISGANNLSAGMVLPNISAAKKSMPVTLTGRVWVYCDATRQPIKPGDLLTTSTIPGHAMKVTNYAKAQGAIIGKAMSSLKSGRGLVLVLVTLQ